jgi:hypothetical protein
MILEGNSWVFNSERKDRLASVIFSVCVEFYVTDNVY